ncbi:MAG: type II toxin-antitoxin system RelE/ParE family toxin [Nitrospiraceae bacterium]|nr:type II toxin-antitoxin system RelE/ParE family toxin [Nitrospiraceae bacterium]
MYRLAIKESLDKKFKRLQKKDKDLLQSIDKKVQDILENPHRFKPLRKPLQNKRRVHVGGSFVLVYELDEEEQVVTLLDFEHHDNVYKTED